MLLLVDCGSWLFFLCRYFWVYRRKWSNYGFDCACVIIGFGLWMWSKIHSPKPSQIFNRSFPPLKVCPESCIWGNFRLGLSQGVRRSLFSERFYSLSPFHSFNPPISATLSASKTGLRIYRQIAAKRPSIAALLASTSLL